MTSRAALFALLAIWGVGTACSAGPVLAEESVARAAEAGPLKRSFSNRVWVKEDTGGLPGVIRIFLSDGTLVQDSCWETHRLSQWRMTSDTGVTWSEDGVDIVAEIVTVSAADLVLAMTLGDQKIVERFVAATVPFVCPDMPKGG